ncbi:ATP-binding protein [Undibacterium sp.]|uniref:ATP-binding protein n=1 Tax=Undibacterium sp. TaxID=1914977 RepID=UPI00273194F5|nr:ATP-binding protein [Undibacterium sp.]MDP1979400.1 ATP-binding protein [Undibacterium sp.]
MNKLTKALARIIREKVQEATQGRNGNKLESRFIFHGPPLDILEAVFADLANIGDISNSKKEASLNLPVLLQMPHRLMFGSNPGIGISGKCDESHLLHIRNDPNSPSFLALVPPGQHNNRSVASTTDEFGMTAASNGGHATFEEWWENGFVQRLVTGGLEDAGFTQESLADARQLVEHAAAAVDEMERDEGNRSAAWRLLSRIYSIKDNAMQMPAGTALSLACGVPPMQHGGLSAKSQLDVLSQMATELADGFKTGVDRIGATTNDAIKAQLGVFLSHIQSTCEVPTAFERATEAFYLPSDMLEISSPPTWWETLTTECWSELLSEDLNETVGDLSVICSNPMLPIVRGMPAIVKDKVELSIVIGKGEIGNPIEVMIVGGSFGKSQSAFQVDGTVILSDMPPSSGQKSPITYKVVGDGKKPAIAKVISIASWNPGILVTCRVANKLSPPKKPRKNNAGVNWESALSLPGSGRYELLILAPVGANIVEAIGVLDDAAEIRDEEQQPLLIREIRAGEYQIEVEVDGKYQLEITFLPLGRAGTEVCRVYIDCEETREEGCRSEFERLIKLNRQHLEKFDSKAVVQLDRHARLSSLQLWMLEEENVTKSFLPLVLADDYATKWAPPNWDTMDGRILSQAKFLHDPRPKAESFQPPTGFIEARKKIAERVRMTVDQTGLIEAAPLGNWISRDPEFRDIVEMYLDSYRSWIASDWEVACWVDAIAVCGREVGGRTLSRIPDAIILSPLHPLRFAWHCLAQQVLFDEIEGPDARPCPASSILDPDCIPDLLTMSLQSPGGPQGIDRIDFLSVECSSDYWSVLWNGSRLGQLAERSQQAPFDSNFGLIVGGISSGFSPAQVARALEDVSSLLAAKPVVSLVVSSTGGSTDACNEGLASWCSRRFGTGETTTYYDGVGPRILEVFDTRVVGSRPDQATIANLSEDTANRVRWFERQPQGSRPDLGIIAQLDSAQPESTSVGMRSPLGLGGLIRHRVRRQLNGAFLSESRQGVAVPSSGNMFADKVANCVAAVEGSNLEKIGLQFAPNVHAISSMLEEKKAGFVAVSSSAIDPACFLGGWINGAYLWDYDLPAYSHRAGDTSGYYLLAQVRDADRDALRRVLEIVPDSKQIDDSKVEEILLEVARRGIPTVRGLSGDDTGATGDLGLFLAVRLLQDQFRVTGNLDSLIPILSGSPEDVNIAVIIPVDPFRGYLADIARSLGKDRGEMSLSRPDLLVVGIHLGSIDVRLQLTPIEVKCRQGSTMGGGEANEALAQARALSSLFLEMQKRAENSLIWRLAFQHLLLSMIGFGMRVYSQHQSVTNQAARWAMYHERIAAAILGPRPSTSIDRRGRLIVIDSTPQSLPRDHDNDGFTETIVISNTDAALMIAGNPIDFYSNVRAKVLDWDLLPRIHKMESTEIKNNTGVPENRATKLKDILVPLDPIYEQEINEDSIDQPRLSLNPGKVELESAHDKASPGILLSVGKSVDGFESRTISLNISDTRLSQFNIGVVGDLGTGKTQLLKSLIAQIATAREENRGIKPRFLIFDYKRDYSNAEFVAATGARVVKPMRLPLNLFDTASIAESAAPWLDRFRFFADVLDKVYTGIGPVQRDKLKGAVRNAYDSANALNQVPTIYDIHAEYKKLLAGKSDSPMAIIDDLVDMEIFERDPKKTIPFDQFLDGVVVISLDAMGQDDRSKNMLVAILLNMFYENMLKTPKRAFIGTEPQLRVIDSYLLVDEAHNIMRYDFDVLRKLLVEGREFGAGIILASQYLRHFKTAGNDYREPLLTWFIHKVPNVTAAELGALGLTADLGELSERVKTLPNHHCLYKSFDVIGEIIRGLPFYELASSGIGKKRNSLS